MFLSNSLLPSFVNIFQNALRQVFLAVSLGSFVHEVWRVSLERDVPQTLQPLSSSVQVEHGAVSTHILKTGHVFDPLPLLACYGLSQKAADSLEVLVEICHHVFIEDEHRLYGVVVGQPAIYPVEVVEAVFLYQAASEPVLVEVIHANLLMSWVVPREDWVPAVEGG